MKGASRNAHGNYTNPCLTMHQPWASLLVYGIKRIEGRSWPSPIRGRLWIHAASKIPDDATIKAMEDFYREIYAVDGVFDLKFPEHYPVSRLIGCVEIVGCVKGKELASWNAVPEGVRLEALTDFCWLCQKPQKLLVPFEMRGYQGVYNLEKKINEAAVRGLVPVKGPLPVNFPLPNPRDLFSLQPGSIVAGSITSKPAVAGTSSGLDAAIAGARAAATQFSKKALTESPTCQQKMKSPVGTASPAAKFDDGNVSLKSSEQTGDDELTRDNNSCKKDNHANICVTHILPTRASTSGCSTTNQSQHKSDSLVGRYGEANSQLSVSEGIGKPGQEGDIHKHREVPHAGTNRPQLASSKLFSAAIGKLGSS
uniref:ASCH domain-containing protein n=2 Tax=Kalanchoe fedtschenkoi TaxID=63787 RepID=A0A7N0T4R5_KALFE